MITPEGFSTSFYKGEEEESLGRFSRFWRETVQGGYFRVFPESTAQFSALGGRQASDYNRYLIYYITHILSAAAFPFGYALAY